PVLRQIARYLPHHRSKNASKTHPKSSHDKFKTASERFSICFKLSSFYVLHIKTVRFPYRERTVFNWRTYGFDMETIKG
ncbi:MULTISPECIES: hypothetical protein, partial [Bacteroides]